MSSIYAGIFLISCATLAFQIGLTRIFSISQWYHFAFMIVSLALLGFGASGSFLSIFPSWFKAVPEKLPAAKDSVRNRSVSQHPGAGFTIISSLFSLTTLLSFIAVNRIPFDSFRIGIEPMQILYLAFLYLSLSIPFFLAGLLIGASLVRFAEKAHLVYFYNLLGSGAGCFLILSIPLIGSADRIPVIAAYIGAVSTLLFSIHNRKLLYISCVTIICITAITVSWNPLLKISLSPYKSLPLALKSQNAEVVSTRENAISRIDIIRSPVVRYAPGLSYVFDGILPAQLGLAIDGENLTGVTVFKTYDELEFIEYLPNALVYKLAHVKGFPTPYLSKDHDDHAAGNLLPLIQSEDEGAEAIHCQPQSILIIEPHGGLDVLCALYSGAPNGQHYFDTTPNSSAVPITVVESNPLIVEMVGRQVKEPYQNKNVRIIEENARTYIRRTKRKFDIIVISLSEAFGPVTSGAFSLREGHLYTVEAIKDYMNILSPEGMLLFTRWLQTPPSESIRLGATIVKALEETGVSNPGEQLIFIRGWMTAAFVVKASPFKDYELEAAKKFCKDRRFDIVWHTDIREEEVNLYNCFSEPYHYRAFLEVLKKDSRGKFFSDYEYDISAVYDNKPFFFHFFKWKQVPSILANIGRRWQAYGGCGYLVVIFLLIIALLASFLLIIMPLLLRPAIKLSDYRSSRYRFLPYVFKYRNFNPLRLILSPNILFSQARYLFLIYFFSLGMGFLFLEISFMHHFILFLGRPTYAFSVVLASLLVFSSIGSLASNKLTHISKIKVILLAIVIAGLIYSLALKNFFYLFMGKSLVCRYMLSLGVLFPIGMLMGFPFPAGLKLVRKIEPSILPWVWGINGCASVIACIAAEIVSLSKGYNWVIISASFFYLIALIVIKKISLLKQV